MPGAAKKRAQKERNAHRGSPEDSKAQDPKPTGGYDGPLDTSESSHGGSNAPGQPGPSTGVVESPRQAPGASAGHVPFSVANVNRRLDLPGNAYNLGSEVSDVQFPFRSLSYQFRASF